MDRPRTPIGWAIRIVSIIACCAVATVLILSSLELAGNFIYPDSGDGFGNPGQLFMAVLVLVLAGPFVALILAMSLPIISKDPRFRGAGR